MQNFQSSQNDTWYHPIRDVVLVFIILCSKICSKNGEVLVSFEVAGIAGSDPTRGANMETLGPRFTPLNRAYDPAYLDLLESTAAELQIKTHRGVYGLACGPSFETPAEVRFLSMIGVDAVGMSTVPEVIAARHCGMRVAVVSAITNVSIHDTESQLDTTEDEVYENASLLACLCLFISVERRTQRTF